MLFFDILPWEFLNADINKCQKFGELFGIAFQIKNDLEKTSAEIDSKNKIFTAKDCFINYILQF